MSGTHQAELEVTDNCGLDHCLARQVFVSSSEQRDRDVERFRTPSRDMCDGDYFNDREIQSSPQAGPSSNCVYGKNPNQLVGTVDVGTSLSRLLRQPSRLSPSESGSGDHFSEDEGRNMMDNILRQRCKSMPPNLGQSEMSLYTNSACQEFPYSVNTQPSTTQDFKSIVSYNTPSWDTFWTSMAILLFCQYAFSGSDTCCQSASLMTLLIVAVVIIMKPFFICILQKII